MKTTTNKEIVALSDFDHILLRPEMYVSSVSQTEEKTILVKEGKIVQEIKEFSIGFYKLLDEGISNSFDEAKRMGGSMTKIEIIFDTKQNSVQIIDTGGGFINASHKNKSGLTNVETAVTMLRAGSNFKNDNVTENLIGMNGIGISATNMLSDYFEIVTVNETEVYKQKWDKFISSGPQISKRKGEQTGTSITFIPRKDIFKKSKWDKELVLTNMLFRQFLRKSDPVISNLEITCKFDDEYLDLNTSFCPEENFKIETKHGTIFVWESFQNSASVSFVNGAQCTGIHQRIFSEWINETFESQNAGKFYEVLLVLNLPPKMVRFGDQNKTRFMLSRPEISPLLEKFFLQGIKKGLRKSEIYKKIFDKIQEAEREGDLKTLKSKKRVQKKKISDKFFPPSERTGSFFMAEGSSALGSLNQKRNTKTDGVYALRGKVRNIRKLSELSMNVEIVDLMNILNIDPENDRNCKYERVIIATDADCLDSNSLIKTISGYKKISKINYNDLVLSHDGKYHKVINIIKTKKKEYIEFQFGDDFIPCSKYHNFMIEKNGKSIKTQAINITKNDFFKLENNTLVNAENIKHIKKRKVMYDIEIEDTNTFYIKTSVGDILSHNCDGHHISSLIINLFHKWFPNVIRQGKLFVLQTPLVSYEDGKKTRYCYSMKDYEKESSIKKLSNIRYLKGLGSLSIKDWEMVFSDMRLLKITEDPKSAKILEMAFGTNAALRKKWLQN